jgi:hypothetical protein
MWDQTFFHRLGVFVGGLTLEAAENVSAGPPVEEALESIASIIDNSLLFGRACMARPFFDARNDPRICA